ncbi:HIT domain-containing protein [Balneatrix alpica]|uniref:HIT domain-containing protein n=1 Tax=Balneatrix alpica TaxID=75684 RepID=A0ABV5Z9L7_9GAMM|nr:HIT domain-containing protein [Balneatrix alpica]
MSCIFCDIAQGRAPAQIFYQDEWILAFADQHPRAPIHILVIPRRHIANLYQISEDDRDLLGHILLKVPQIAHAQGLQAGFKLQVNTGPAGGQEIYHLHLHLTGSARTTP